MLAFYPEFEAAIDPSPEVIFLVDLSNSMKGDPFRDARKVCSLKKKAFLSLVSSYWTCYQDIITMYIFRIINDNLIFLSRQPCEFV